MSNFASSRRKIELPFAIAISLIWMGSEAFASNEISYTPSRETLTSERFNPPRPPSFAKYDRNFFESARTPIFAPTSAAEASLKPKSAKPLEKSPLRTMFGAAQAAHAKSEKATIDFMFLSIVGYFLSWLIFKLVDLHSAPAE